jgi:30S ribosomal protein S31
MGRGDKRTKRGKISLGSFGKSRPKASKKRRAAKATA